MNLKLEDKTALVTGSTAGIGFAIARSLAAEGTLVIVNGRTEARVSEAIASIRKSHPNAKLEPFAANLANAEAATEAARRFPSIDILINNLGVYEPKPFEQITDDDWYAIIEANFMSGVRLSRHYMPRMKAANLGRIIFISSESALNIPVEMIHYGVTKTMQVALARGLAETTAGTVDRGIRLSNFGTLNDINLGTADNECHAAYLEVEFIDVAVVDNLLNAPGAAGDVIRRGIAHAIAQAIVDDMLA